MGIKIPVFKKAHSSTLLLLNTQYFNTFSELLWNIWWPLDLILYVNEIQLLKFNPRHTSTLELDLLTQI